MFIGWLAYGSGGAYFLGGWVALTGVAAFAMFGVLNAQDNAHSPSGVERQRNALTADVAKDTHEASVNAWRDVAMAEINARYGYLNQVTMLDHEDRMKRLEDKRK